MKSVDQSVFRPLHVEKYNHPNEFLDLALEKESGVHMSGRRSNYNCKSWFRCLVRMPLGRLPEEVFLAHSTKRAWIRPWICWRNYISHLAWEHLEPPPPSRKLLPLWPRLQMKMRQDVYVKQPCESKGNLDKQNKTKNVVSIMWRKPSPYLAAHPDIEMLFWRSLMWLVVEFMWFFSSLNSIMWFSLSTHSLALLPVVGSEGLVLTTGASWSDEWQRGTASGLRHKQ